MATPADKQYLIDAFDPLRAALHDDLPSAADAAESHFIDYGMANEDYRGGQAHLARCHARRLLSRRTSADLGGWTLAQPGPNASLWLTRDALSLRFMRPLPGSEVPPPGPNGARIAYYSNRHATLFGVGGSDLIALWDVDQSGEGAVRVVRTVGRWKYGAKAKLDIDFYIPALPDSLNDTEFHPTDEDDDQLGLWFPRVDDEGEEGTGESDG